jgi:2-oxoglutarate ferredoxin oxidoreductase subunit delta
MAVWGARSGPSIRPGGQVAGPVPEPAGDRRPLALPGDRARTRFAGPSPRPPPHVAACPRCGCRHGPLDGADRGLCQTDPHAKLSLRQAATHSRRPHIRTELGQLLQVATTSLRSELAALQLGHIGSMVVRGAYLGISRIRREALRQGRGTGPHDGEATLGQSIRVRTATAAEAWCRGLGRPVTLAQPCTRSAHARQSLSRESPSAASGPSGRCTRAERPWSCGSRSPTVHREMAGTLVPEMHSTARPPFSFTRLLIATDRCKGCELCIQACAPGVLALDRSRVNALGYNPIHAVALEQCTSCALCARVCPDAVFTVYTWKAAAK